VPEPSSCIAPPVAGQCVAEDVAGVFAVVREGCGALAEYLDQVVDHRSRQGLRYKLGFLPVEASPRTAEVVAGLAGDVAAG